MRVCVAVAAPHSPWPVDDIVAVRGKLEQLAEQGRTDELITMVLDLLVRVRDDNTALQVRLHNALRQLYGRRSEKVSAEQLSLLFEQLGDEAPEGAAQIAEEAKQAAEDAAAASDGAGNPGAESDSQAAVPQPNQAPRPLRSRKGCSPLPEHLPRQKNVILVAQEQRTCAQCGAEKQTIGYETSEYLEFVPAQLVVIEQQREKIACKSCDEPGIVVAPNDKVMPYGRPGPRLLAHVVNSKHDHSQPLYRQSNIFEQTGVRIADSTLGDWNAFALEVLAPIANLIGQIARSSFYINLDDTGFRVLDKKHPKGVKHGHLWGVVADQKYVYVHYAPDWKAEHLAELLRDFKGFAQVDGYRGYGSQTGPPEDTHAIVADDRRLGCAMHVRRPFEQAADGGDARGAIALAYFRKLYDIERACKQEELSPEERLQRRQQFSVPVLGELYEWIDMIHPTLVPGTPLHKATQYARGQRDYLERCFTDGRFEIDNGEVERQFRRPKLGAKNFLFAGSDAGARRLAVGYTIIQTCLLNGVNPEEYMADVIVKLQGGWLKSRLHELLPDQWQAARQRERAAAIAAAR
jgi:transposase